MIDDRIGFVLMALFSDVVNWFYQKDTYLLVLKIYAAYKVVLIFIQFVFLRSFREENLVSKYRLFRWLDLPIPTRYFSSEKFFEKSTIAFFVLNMISLLFLVYLAPPFLAMVARMVLGIQL